MALCALLALGAGLLAAWLARTGGREGGVDGGDGTDRVDGAPGEETAALPEGAEPALELPSSYVPLMNIAQALLENGDPARAAAALEKALEIRPESVPARRNLARAHLGLKAPERAVAILEDVERSAPGEATTSYLLGIALARESRFAAAVPALENAVRLDPQTAALRFQLAIAYESIASHDRSLEQLKETVRLDPLHRAAHFRLAMKSRERGDTEAYSEHYREFLRLKELFRDEDRAPEALEHCVHTNAEWAEALHEPRGAAPSPDFEVSFSDATREAFAAGADRAAAITALEMDGEGRYTFLVVKEDGRLALAAAGPDGRLEETLVAGKALDLGRIRAAIAGDFSLGPEPEAPRLADVFLLGDRGAALFFRRSRAELVDVTEAAGLSGLSGNAARWVDCEHDGDLDLLIARETGLEAWQNNGNGTFQDVTRAAGIDLSGSAADVVAVDLDFANEAVDIIAARGDQPTAVFKGRREGTFARLPEPPGPWPAARRVLADDIDNDGHADVILAAGGEAVVIYGRTGGRSRIDLEGLDVRGLALVDYDNDGWSDLCAAGARTAPAPGERGAVRVWRNLGAGWREVTSELALDQGDHPAIDELLAADLDADGDTDLLLRDEGGGLRLLRNAGGNANRQMKFSLLSLSGSLSSTGTRIEVRESEFRAARWTQRETPIEIGIGRRSRLDSVQTLWPNGVLDNRVNVDWRREPYRIAIVAFAETGSCPFLYAWNGSRFVFITDLLAGATVNVSAARGLHPAANPREVVVIGDEELLKPDGGAYPIKITSELREATLIDALRLVAVDHAPGVEVHSTSKLHSPPFAPSEATALEERIPLEHALGSDGIDRTEELREIDGRLAAPGPLLPQPLAGITRPFRLTFEFAGPAARSPEVLALTGWVNFSSSSSNVAIAQSGADVVWPVLEAQAGDGRWLVVETEVGIPSGKTKTILCRLAGKLPEGARSLRLTTTFEIRWDRIALFCRETVPERVLELSPGAADLHWRGFSELKPRGPREPPTPDHDTVSAEPAWPAALEGWYTRFGDATELVAEADGRLAILGSGDALTVRFPAALLPPVPDGMRRTFLLSAEGWVKEGDPNSAASDRLAPLPGDAGGTPSPGAVEDPSDWRFRFNTRWIPRDRFAGGR
jgi:tetratricopeptide (TPR) repeat protein